MACLHYTWQFVVVSLETLTESFTKNGNKPNMQEINLICIQGQTEIAGTLIEKGANVNHLNKYGRSALYYAALNGNN